MTELSFRSQLYEKSLMNMNYLMRFDIFYLIYMYIYMYDNFHFLMQKDSLYINNMYLS